MDVNMNNVKFFKKIGDDWVYLAQSEEDEEGIKVFYDDGSLKNSKLDMATYYQNYMKDIAGKNNLAAIDYFVSSVDFLTTLGISLIEAKKIAAKPVKDKLSDIVKKYAKEISDYFIATQFSGSNDGTITKEMSIILNTALNHITSTSPDETFMSLICAVYIPSLITTMNEYNCKDFGEFADVYFNGKNGLLVPGNTNDDGTHDADGEKDVTAQEVQNKFLRQMILNQYSADIMGNMMFLGGVLNFTGPFAGFIGKILIGIAKPLSGAIKNVFDNSFPNGKQLGFTGLSQILNHPSFKTEFAKCFVDYMKLPFDTLTGNRFNMIEWHNVTNGIDTKYFTEFNVDSTGLLDVILGCLNKLIDKASINETELEKDLVSNVISGVKGIVSSSEGAANLIKNLGGSTDIVPIRGYFDDKSGDISYNKFYFREDKPYFEYNAKTKEIIIKTTGSEKDSFISQLLEELNSELTEIFSDCVKLGKVKVLKGAYYLPSRGLIEAQEYKVYNYEAVPEWFDLKGLEVKNENGTKTGFNALGFKAEEILYHNGLYNEIFKDKVFSKGKYFFVEYENFNENLLSLRVPTIGNNSSESKLILGDNIFQNETEKFYNAKGVGITGGIGNDTIYGGIGKDTIYGGEGNDIIYGGNYNKKLEKLVVTPYTTGGESSYQGESKEGLKLTEIGDYDEEGDIIYGGAGDDHIYGQRGKDFLYGDGGSDHIWGGADSDFLEGGAGDDFLIGGIKATFRPDGDKSTDYLIGGAGDDYLIGGAGVDEYIFDVSENNGNDLVIDTDKRGRILLRKTNDVQSTNGSLSNLKIIEIEGSLNGEDFTIENDGGKIKDFNGKLIRWEYGRFHNGKQIDTGTSITIIYTNENNEENKITIDNFVKQYTVGLGYHLQEWNVGLKFKSALSGNNEIVNTIMTPFAEVTVALGTFVRHGMAVTWGAMNSAFQFAMNTSLNIINKGCKLDPLILDLDGDGVETSAMEEGTYFDLNSDGSKEKAGWVGKDDGLLVYDKNGNGVIDSGRELFGDATRLRDGRIAESGFEALSEFDTNGDSIVDNNDRGFGRLQIWQDSNSDGVSQIDELKSLGELGITSIDLKNETVNREQNGNIEVRKSTYTKSDATTGTVAEYQFLNDIFDYKNRDDIIVSEETKGIMDVNGSGLVQDLEKAMTLDETGELKYWVQTFVREKDFAIRRDLIQNEFLYQWAGVSKVDSKSRGEFIDARKLATLEKFMGMQFKTSETGLNPDKNAAPILERIYAQLLEKVYIDMMVQSHLKPYFDVIGGLQVGENITYDLTRAQEAIQEVIDSDYTYGKQVLNDFIAAFRIYGLDSKSNLDKFCERFASQGEDLEWIVNSAGTIKIEGTTRIEKAYANLNGKYTEIGTIEKYDDNIEGTSDGDAINGHYGNDAIKSGSGDDYIYGEEGDDSLYGEDGNDLIRGGEGSDYISGGAGNDDISGGDGADNIIAGSGNDIVVGGIGNDNIQGGAGDDKYIYSYGSGNDIIVETSGNDTIIAEFLNINDVNFSNDGLDLVMTVTAIGEKLIIKDYFRSESYRVEKIQFVDGNIGFEEIITKLDAKKGTDESETLFSDGKFVLGAGGNDVIKEVKIATGGDGDDTLKGSIGNDKLYGGTGDDVLDGGEGDDYLEGEAGDDTYKIRRNMGNDTIFDTDGNNSIDFIDVESTITKYYRVGDNLEFRCDSSRIATIKDYFIKPSFDYFSFADNVVISDLTTQTIYVEGSDLRDNIEYNDGYNYSIVTFDNYDTVIAGMNKDNIDGGKGDDYLLGNNQDDVIYGGAGNDKIYGDNDSEKEGAVKNFGDIFIQASSDNEYIMEQIREITGNDDGVIFDSKAFLQKQLDEIAEGNDEMHGGFGDDYLEGGKKDDILYGDDGNDHLMGDGYYEEQIEGKINIIYHNGNDTLYGGSGDDWIEGSKGNDKLYSGDGDDVLEADGYDVYDLGGEEIIVEHVGNDILDGGSGNDKLIGGMGDDTYIFKKGYNHDEIIEMGGNDILDMQGILSSEATFIREMNTLKISVGESEQIKLTDYFLDKENGDTGDFLIETIRFSDIAMSYMDVLRKIGIIGTSGNDSIPGNEKDNIIFGESGDDVITDDLGMDKIYGGAGNDTIYSGMENDVVFGEEGKDTIYGGYGNDTIKGGYGNDNLYGGENNDYIEGNEGNDYIDGGYGKDEIYGGTGNDIINSSGDDDIVYGNEGDDVLLTESGDDKVYGGEGNDVLITGEGDDKVYGEEGSDVIKAGEGNDYIIADTNDIENYGNDKVYAAEGDDYIKTGAGDDYLDGNVGKDIMIGGKGADTYVFGIGYGTDTIMEGGDLSVDTIEMTEGVTKDNIAIKFKKYDLILTIKDTNDKLVISDYFRKDENKIERIKFFDGTEMDLKSLTDQWIIKGTLGNDTLNGTELDDLIFGYQGDDIIYGYGGNDTLNGGEGNDLLFGGAGNDYLDGETGNDSLDGGSGDDELEGGAGDDIYVFAKGYDRDVIIEDRETNPSDKTIIQINDIAPSKVSFMKVFDNLEIYAEGTAARLVINDFFKDNRNKIDEIQFSNGIVWSLEDIKNKPISIIGTDDDEFFKADRTIIDDPETRYLNHSDYRYISNAGDGDDIIETGSKNDIIYGEAGNDFINGMGGNDILRGGIGNDSISGGTGNDIISGDEENDNLYGDEGNDTIDGGQGNDIIGGGSGDDLIVDNEGNNKIDGGQGNDKINTGSGNDYVSGGAGKDIISTYNGNDSISGDEGNDSIYAGEGNDIISGGSGDDLIDAGLGDDIISGNEGDDYYYFGKGDGHDTITEEGWGFDKIVFKDNVLISDVKIMKNIFDLIISIVDIDGNIADSITIKNYFNSPYKMVERIVFANGTEWDSFDVSEKLKIIGTSGDDIIIGTEYGDLIYAEDGNDAVNALGDNDGIRGGLGNDTIHGNTGDDYIYGEAGSDTLYGDEGDDVIEGASGNDIVYGGLGNDIISSGDDKDTVYGEAGNDSIRGGTGNDRIEGGLGNDIIYGNEDSDELYGQEGIDTIYGGEGNDFIEGGADNDFIEGGYGSDILNGGSGDDRIVGYVLAENTLNYSNDDNDIIHGNDGNDNISAGYGDDEVYGDSGNDYIEGGDGNDILSGGAGNDTIFGGSGDDTILGGDGDDIIISDLGNDILSGGAGNDTIISGVEDNEVYGDSGNDGIRTGAGDDIIHGGEGNDRLYGESGFDIIYGDSGNDELYGGIDSDVLEGGIGNDYLEGGTGEDKYVFGLGFGQDVIVDYDKSLENIDKIVFKPEITSYMLDLSRDVYNLIIKVKNTSDMITIKDYFKDEYSKIEVIEFADGTLWGAEKISERVGIFYGTDLGEEILGSDVNNLMYGLGGADKLYGKEGDDIIEGGLGDDYIEGNEGKDDLKGGLGNDIISGGLDADLIKGDDGNDSLYGDSGNDTIYGDIGDDKIYGGDGSDVIYTGKGNDIAYGDAGDDRIVDEFGDDKIFGGEGNDSIDAGSGDDYVEGGLGNDRINLGAGIDLAYGGEGNDVITGDMSDTVYGDVGDDNISGVYKAFGGEGNDVINSSIAYGDSGNDSISVTANGFAFGGDGDDSLTGSGGSESLEGGLGNDIIYGNDGNDLLLGQEGNDNISGGYGDDRLDGGVGNDYLEDISGNDLYFFGSGYGNDIIYDKNGSLDRIKFGVGILQNSLNFSNIGYDLVISIKKSEDTLTIKDYFKAQEYQIEKFEFFDGSIFKVNDSIKDMNFSEVIGTAENDILYGVKNISGLDGNDNITGSILADTITGGLGNDILVGGLGNDKYVFSSGDGSDTITDFEDTSNNSDTIYINGTKTNYNIKRENYNLIISSNLNQDKITVVNYYLSDAYKIENVNFSDGTLFSKDDLINLTLLGTDKNDSLIGGYGNDIINGLKGDDYLEGKTGNDTYIYGKGYGNDTIFDESGVDVIKLLEGVSPEEVTLRQVDSNLQLVIETTGEILTIKDYYNPYSDKKIESIVFSDSTSTTWNNEIIAQKRIYKFGDISDNMIDGSDKSDSIYGWEGNDVLNGGAGNDLIFGGYGNDRLTGGVGSDVLDGSYGDDTYYISFDNAKDLIRDSQGTDTIKFSKDLTTDIVRVQRNNSNLDIYAKTSDNTESIIATIENYYTSPYWWDPNAFKVENLQFADKTVWDVNTVDQKAYTFIGNESDEVLGGYDHSLNIIANEGNDTLKGSRYNDTFNGGLGNDLIEGGYGSDTYLFNKGDGKDTISDNSYAGYWGVGDNGTDKIKFGENITLNDIILVKKGNNLELRLKDISNISKDSITVSDYFRKEDRYWAYGGTYSPYTIEQMEFNDGKIINIAELLSPGVLIGDATSGADTLETGVAINSIIYGEAGNDTLIGNNAIDTLYGGDDSDLLVGNDGNDILYGGTGNDTLKAGNGNDFLEGDAGTDRLEGNFGSDVYFFKKGFGIDTIKDDGYSGYWGTGDTGTDKLKFGADIALNDILLAKKGNNLELRFNNIDKLNTDKIIIEDYFKREERYWAYGGAFDPYKIEKVEFSNGDVIDLTSMFTKGIIIDEITENADVVNMNIQYDGLIFGGKGNDQITGNSGNDKLYGEEDNDILSGGAGDDILSGGLGNDIIDSGTGNNVIIYNLGEGIDTIKISANSNNTLKLGEGILRENVVITREGHNLVIFDGQSTDKVIVENWYYGKKLNEIQFADGSSMDLSTLHNQGLVVRGTENADEILGEGTENDELHGESGNDTLHGLLGNDTLYGESGDDAINGGDGNDIIVGGTGNDNLQGGANDDLYIFNKEDGQDIIYDHLDRVNKYWWGTTTDVNYYNAGTDTIKFGEGIVKEDLWVKLDGNNLQIGIKNADKSFDELSDKITIKDFKNSNSRIEFLEFSNGVKLGLPNIISLLGTTLDDNVLWEETSINLSTLDGNDNITTGSYDDIIDLGRGNDKLNSGAGQDIVHGNEGNDTIFTSTGNDLVYGEDGEDTIDGGEGNDSLYGGNGNDTLTGGTGDDLISGGSGKDILIGNLGSNIYAFNLGDGDDTIKSTIGSFDIIQFGEGVFKDNISFTREGHNLIVRTSNAVDKIVVENWYLGNKLEKILFADGTEMLKEEIHTKGLVVKDILAVNQLTGEASENDVLYGLDGDDIISGGFGNDTLYGDEGNDTIDGGADNDLIYGGNNNDILVGGLGNDILVGGLGADILSGGSGNNIYEFSLGDGQDVIRSNTGSSDTLKLAEGMTRDNISFTREGHNLIITSNETDKITVENWYLGNKLEKILFADGTEILKDEIHIKGLVVKGTSTDDTLNGEGTENDVLYGLDGNDTLNGLTGNDTLVGGLGNDILVGGLGNNTYEFSLGDGQDTIRSTIGSSDILKLSEGMTRDNISFTREGHNLIVITSNVVDKIVVENWYLGNKLEKILFADGTEMIKDEIHIKGLVVKGTSTDDTLNGEGTENDVLYGLEGNDILNGLSGDDTLFGGDGQDTINSGTGNDISYGQQGNDTIFGNEGNDILQGNEGDDSLSGDDGNDILVGGIGNDTLIGGIGNNIYEFSLGDGQDTIKSTIGSSDTLKLAEGMTRDNISFTREGHNLIIIISNGIDKITVENWYLGNKLEKILFADGTEMLKDEIHIKGLVVKGTSIGETLDGEGSENDVLYGLEGNDTLNGLLGNDILIGGKGNDILVGGLGNNTYEFSLGDGEDIIRSTIGSSDTLKLAEGMTRDNISFTREGHNLIIRTSNGVDKITVENWYLGNKLEKILFTDGTEMLKDEIHIKGLVVKGTSLGETLDGEGSENDVLYGLDGNDTLNGLSGNDILIGGKGNDTLVGGLGNNTYEFSLGDGQDIIKVETSNENTETNTLYNWNWKSTQDWFGTSWNDGGNDAFDGFGNTTITINGQSSNLNYGVADGTTRVQNVGGISFNTRAKFISENILELYIGAPSDLSTLMGLSIGGNLGSDGNENYSTGVISLGGKEINYVFSTDRSGNDPNVFFMIIPSNNEDVSKLSYSRNGDNVYGNINNANFPIRALIIPSKQTKEEILSLVQTIPLFVSKDILNLGEGITKDNISFTREGHNLIIITPNLNDKIIIENWYLGNKLHKILFADGTELSREEIHIKGLVVKGTSLGETLDGEGSENDVLSGLEGNDTLNGLYGNDVLYGGSGDDIIKGGEGNDTSYGGEGSDNIYGDNGDDTIYGDSGNDIIEGGNGDDILYGGEGNDVINSGNGNNLISGGLGDDILSGGLENNIYNYSLGEGNDTITATNLSNNDKLVFSNISSIDIKEVKRVGIDGKDVIITFKNNETITLISQNISNIESFVFTDKIILANDLIKLVEKINGSENNDHISGYERSEVISAGLGDDTVYGNQGNDIIYGNEGLDKLYGNEGADSLYGNQGNDILEGSEGNDTLDGGEGDDTLSGGFGNDTYIFRVNNGNDIIQEDDDFGNSDKIILEGLNKSDITLERIENTLIIIMNKTGETLTINDYFGGVRNKVENIIFQDGSIWDKESVKDYLGYDKNSFSLILNSDNSYNVNFKKYNIKFGVKIFKGDDGLLHSETSFNYSNNSQERLFETLKLEQKMKVQINNYLDQLLKSNIPLDILSESFNERFDEIREITVQCLEFREDFKEDAVLGNLKSLNLEGDTDENLLEGDILEDILDGGLGNDVLIGKSGNDTYIFGKGYGEDTILDFDSDKNSQDVIQMRDIASSEAVLTRNNFDLEISCGQDKLIVKNYFDGLRFKIEKIEFSDNVTWTREDINFKLEQNIDIYSIKVENDSLFKVDFKVGNLSVTLNFSLENGFVKGGTLISYYNSDLAEYNAFIASKEYKILSSQVSSLVSQFTESNMPLSNWKTNLVNDMDNLKELIAQNLIYSDINFDYSMLTSNLLSTDGNDSLRGTNKGDILDGGLGNDTLEGGLGNDKYIFAKGYGEDTIIENDGTTNNLDIIEMKDITSEEATLSKEGLNLLITCGNDKLIVQDYFSSVSNKIEKIVFSDGITYLNADIESKIGISKNDFNISIISDSNFLFSFTRSEVTITVIYLNGKFGYQLDGFQEAIDNFTNSGEKGILSSQVSEYANQIVNSDIDLNNCISSIENNMDFINNIIKNSFKIEAIVEGSPEPEKLEYIGTDLNDIFTGNSNNEIFDGKLGDDTLEGKAGDDTYIFGKGYGVDTIYEDDFTIGNIDTLKLKDILLSEIIALRNEDNLEIAITNSTDKVILNNYFGNSNNKIEKIEFADGTILDNKTLYQMMGLNVSGYRVAVTDVGFTLVFNTMNVEVSTKFYIDSSNQLKYDMPTFKYDSVDEFNNFGSTGWPKCNVQLNNFLNKLYESNLDFTNMKDVIKNNEELFRDMLTQSFEFKQETKMSYLTQEISYEGDTTVPANMNVLGSGSSNILTGDRGNDILDGLAGNDMLDGGTGNDTYIFGKGYGIDTIFENDSTVGNIDTIKMKDMTSTIAVAARNGNNLEITATGFTDKLIVSNYFSGTNNKVEKVVFSDNIVWDKNMINQKAGLNATSYKVELKGTTFDLTFVRDNVTVKTTFSVVGGVSIASGSTYSGTTTNLNAFTAAKKAIVTNQITQFKTDFINAGLGLTDWNNQLTANSRILNEIISQSFEFKGRSVVDTMTATTNSMFLSGGSGADVITGNTGNDVLIGGAGNDTLKGAAGNDTYIFGRGDGIDTVTDTAGADILRINANPLDLIFDQTGTDLDISINGTTDKVTVKSWFSGATNQIEKIVANDTELLLNTSVQGMIQAMSAFDSGNQMTWSQSIQNKPKETNDVLSQYWGHQTTMVK